ncbi:hypothetical protein MBLNU230_g6269t2 [Neophaeotheca triangularis]
MAGNRRTILYRLVPILLLASAAIFSFTTLSDVAIMPLKNMPTWLPFLSALTVSTVQAIDCDSSAIQSLLPSTATVSSAVRIPQDGTFRVPRENIAYPTSPTSLRANCAVQVKVTSSESSAYSFGMFLPDDWNERSLSVGNGGFAGGINWLDMGAGLGYGFAVMSTDTGHSSISSDLSWALDQPEKKIDWGYRAMHGSVVLAKQIIKGYYGSKPKYNYYSGCSTGGRQGIRDIQLYPEDFDGVLAGAPAWWTSNLQTWTNYLGLVNLPTDSASYIPPEAFETIGDEVMKQCDPQDGLVDNIISNPRGCNFDAKKLLCAPNVKDQAAARCLKAPQLETLQKIYSDYLDPSGKLIFPHIEMGSEAQWSVLLGGTNGKPNPLGYGYIRYFLLNNPDWDFRDYDYSLVELANRLDPGNATANDYDLSPFKRRGGKLLHYHGEADSLIPSGSSYYFYNQVLRTLQPKGVELDSWYRFFPVPGMLHCAGTAPNSNAPWYFAGGNQAGDLGTGVSGVPGFEDEEHDALLALMAWTERDVAPEKIVATKWVEDDVRDEVLRQRPLCPFPKVAKFDGSGHPDEADSWSCGESDDAQARYGRDIFE